MTQTTTNTTILFKVFVSLVIALHSVSGYCWDVLDNDKFTCNNNQTCNGRPHSSCLQQQPIHKKNCDNLNLMRVLTLSFNDRNMLLNGHNGLRNRVAIKLDRPVANMNILYWSEQLQQMAEGWIKQCTIDTDACDFIYNHEWTVGQNIRFECAETMSSRWIVQIVKHWYLEGKIDLSDTQRRKNYSQMIWPITEFVGCAAAEYVNGYMVACNYHPRANASVETMFIQGEPCSKCSRCRNECSHRYNGLCGIDIPLSRSERVYSNLLAVSALLASICTFNILQLV